MQLIEINAEYGLAYTDDYAGIRAMLKDTAQMDSLVEDVESSVLCEELDPTKSEDALKIRANVAFAKKVKTRLEKIRTEAVADLKKEPKKVEDAVRPYVKRLETLAETIGRPLAEMDARADRLRIFSELPNRVTFAPLEQLRQELATAQAMDASADTWLEKATEAAQVKAGVVEALEAMIAKKAAEEAEKAELERLREEQRKREHAEDLERARKEGEEKAKRELAEREAAKEAQAKQAAAQAFAVEEARKAAPAPAQVQAQSEPRRYGQSDAEMIAEHKAHDELIYQEAYNDLRAVIVRNGFGDLAKAIIEAVKAGAVRNITTTIR